MREKDKFNKKCQVLHLIVQQKALLMFKKNGENYVTFWCLVAFIKEGEGISQTSEIFKTSEVFGGAPVISKMSTRLPNLFVDQEQRCFPAWL